MEKEIRFKTQGELAAYLMNKGPLKIDRWSEIYFDPVNHPDDPFRYKSKVRDEAMEALWDVDGRTYYTKPPWHKCIPDDKYVPCYVSDSNEMPGPNNVSGVVRYSEECDCYISLTNTEWLHATPIPADKLWIPGLEE